MKSRFIFVTTSALLVLAGAASAHGQSPYNTSSATTRAATAPDPRIGLKAGWFDAGQALWNLQLISTTPPSDSFLNKTNPGDFNFINSDLSFRGNYVIQGNFSGVQVWDISDIKHPVLRRAFVCPGSQSDVSVYRNLLFVSGEALNGRTDCGKEGVADTVSHDRLRGIRIFDATDISNPRHITDVQTCRGSHTHTVVTQPNDTDNVYIYVSGSAPVRSPNELAGCAVGTPDSTPNTALFRIEVIQVPLAHPEQAHVVSSPRIFQDLVAPPRHGEAPEDIAEAKRQVDSARAAGGFVLTFEGRRHPRPRIRHRSARQHRESTRRHGDADRRRHVGAAQQCAEYLRAARRSEPPADGGWAPHRPDAVPRHHGLSGHRVGGRRVRWLRSAPRYPRRGQPEAHRGGGRFELLVLALCHVQQ